MQNDVLEGMAIIFMVGIGAQWIAWWMRVPSILLLLIGGLLVGPVLNLVHPHLMLGQLLFPLISLSVAIILFEGGMSLRLAEFKRVGRVVRNLITLGMLVTWLLSSSTAYFLFGLSPALAVLLGAIMVVSGPTVVGPLLQQVRPTKRVGEVLKWEGILIDPIGALLSLLVFEIILATSAGHAVILVVTDLARMLLVGVTVSLAGTAILVVALRRYWIPDMLQNPVALTAVIAVYTIAERLQPGSGLLAVTLMGIALTNQRYASVRHIVEFKESLRVILLAWLFILLPAQLDFNQLRLVWIPGLLFLTVLVIVVRPLAVFLSTIGSGMPCRERFLVAWVAPRGVVAASVSSVFAIRLAGDGFAHADRLVPITFLVIIGTVAIYGLTAAPIAQALRIAQPRPQGILFVGAFPWVCQIARALQNVGVPGLIVDSNAARIAAARETGLQTFHASILSDSAAEEMDLTQIGRLFALTSNDEVNSLAVQRYTHLFGRAEVYQLPPKVLEETRMETIPLHQRGRLLFKNDLNFSVLQTLFDKGAGIETSQLTADSTCVDIQRTHPEGIPLFIVSKQGTVQVVTADHTPEPPPDSTLISLMPATEAAHAL